MRPASIDRRRATARISIALCLTVVLGSCGDDGSSAAQEEDRPPTIVAVGDIACGSPAESDGDRCRYDDVAELVHAEDPDLFLALGDVQYAAPDGAVDYGFYDAAFGDLLARTLPTAGDEDWGMDRKAFLDYFAGRTTKEGYDATTLERWHIVVLNSQDCLDEDGCGPGSPQYLWLRDQLASPPPEAPVCTLAIWHDPRFLWTQWWTKDGEPRGPQDAVAPLWELLADADAEIVLNGNAHHYERWEPMDDRGQVASGGITQFVVGTGGKSLNPLGPEPRPFQLASAYDGGFGVLVLELGTAWLDYRWAATDASASFTDAGTIFCA